MSVPSFYDIAPLFRKIRDDVLYGDVWQHPDLSLRDRSLITCCVLVADGRNAELEHHLGVALKNGVTKDELLAMITHISFYAGTPMAVNAARVATQVLNLDQE